jgi:energy-coupling factor transport system permease protein
LFILFLLGGKLSKNKSGWISINLKFLISMVLISAIVNGIFSHLGQTVLFYFPEKWLLIGGKITLESIIYGIINGMVIGALYLTFNILNLALNTKQMSQLIPRSFHTIAMTTTIALTFFPSIKQRAYEIKEAQMIRGNPMKSIPDWLPILMPLVVTSLEDAILLSESMTSRGFLPKTSSKYSGVTTISLVLGTFSVFSGWLLNLYNYPRYLSITLYLIGGLVTLTTLYTKGHEVKVTRYRQEKWQTLDILAGIFYAFAILAIVFLSLTNRLEISYSPYPSLTSPNFNSLGIFLSMMPIIPWVMANHD